MMKSKKTETVAEPRENTAMALADVSVASLSETTLQAWADRGTQLLRKTVESVIATGQFFIEAKASVPPGQFGRIFKDHTEHVARPMNITQHMAEQYMAVAENPTLSNSTRWVELPSSYRTLYVLTRLPQEKLEMLIAGGIVRPELTRNEAEALVYASKKYTSSFSVVVAQKVLSLARREITTSRLCQCSYCGHEHYEKRSKSRTGPKDPLKHDGKGTA